MYIFTSATIMESFRKCRSAANTTGRRKRHATVAVMAATAAALCNMNVGTADAFVVDSTATIAASCRGPLHLKGIVIETQTTGVTTRLSMMGSRNGDGRSSDNKPASRLNAVTDPEVLLKDLFLEQQSTSKTTSRRSSSNKAMKGNKKSGQSPVGRKSKRVVSNAGTIIKMNMEDLYKLESSFGLESADMRTRTNISVEKMKKPKKSARKQTSKQQPSKKTPAASTAASISPPRNKIETPTARKSIKNTTVHGKKKPNTTTLQKKSRSSTMPGFRNNKSSQRHAAFRDGLALAKKSNNKDVAAKIHRAHHTKEAVFKRKKSNSDSMYMSSASVPDSLIAFTNELHQESRITPKEEIELGTKTQDAIELQNVYSNLEKKLGRPPTDGEWCAASGKINIEALNAALEEGIEAKHRLVTSNLRMVQGVVNLYIRNGLGSQYNAGDLMQDGTAALIRAAEKFEPSRGFRFSTYAMYWIRAAVKRSQILQSSIISVPQRLHETHKKITKTESELRKELGRPPRKDELAKAVDITEVQLERCMKAMEQKCFSLDAELENSLNPNKSGNKETMYNVLSAQYDNVEYKQTQSGFLKDDLVSTLKRYLTPHEVDLILLRYGLMDERTMPYGFSGPLTIAEVSRLVGLKPDKVRRIINKCLRRLRHLIAHEWEDFERELP